MGARGGRDLGGKPGPRAETPPEAPLTPCLPPPLPRGAPHSPPLFTLPEGLRKHSRRLEGGQEGLPGGEGEGPTRGAQGTCEELHEPGEARQPSGGLVRTTRRRRTEARRLWPGPRGAAGPRPAAQRWVRLPPGPARCPPPPHSTQSGQVRRQGCLARLRTVVSLRKRPARVLVPAARDATPRRAGRGAPDQHRSEGRTVPAGVAQPADGLLASSHN